MSGQELSRKADLELANLTSGGGLLTMEQNETFIRRLEDSKTILNAMRVYPMNGPTARINAIGFGNFITYPASQDRNANTTGFDGRKFKPAWRSAPTTTHVDLATKEVMAVILLPYEVLEDNIERGALQNTVLALIADRFATDMEAMVVRGVSGGSDPIPLLNYMDGVYQLSTDHVVDAAGQVMNDALFTAAIKAMPKKYRNNLESLRFLMGSDASLDLRDARSARATLLGDRFVEDNSPLRAKGIQCLPASANPESQMMLTIPQNLIFGIQRNVRVEVDKDIETREVKIVVTARVACEVENHDAVVKVVNIGQP